MATDQIITNETSTEPEASEEPVKDQERSNIGLSLLGAVIVPVKIYGYLRGPDRYSAKRLEKEANKHAAKSVKAAEKAARKAKNALSEDERKAIHDKSKRGFYEEYVENHEKRARKLNKDPKTDNPLLKTALFNKDAKSAISAANLAAQKDSTAQYSNLADKTKIQTKEAIATATAQAKNDSASQHSDLPQRTTPSPPSSNSSPSPSRRGLDSVNKAARKGAQASKNALNELKSVGKVLRAVANLLRTGPGLPAIIVIIVVIVLIVIVFMIVFGGGNNSQKPAPIPPTQANLPQVLVFNGGYAYLSCSNTTRISCPPLAKDTPVTFYVVLNLKDKTLIKDPNAALIILKISSGLFSNIKESNVNPPYDFSLKLPIGIMGLNSWKLSTLEKQGGNSYLITVTEKVVANSGSADVSLSLSGFDNLTLSDTIPN